MLEADTEVVVELGLGRIDLEETDDLLAEEEAAATEATDELGVSEGLVLLGWHPAQDVEEAGAIDADTLVTKLLPASQAVQSVEVDVMVRVDTVLNTDVTGVPSDEMVEITGQVVVASYATTVVVEPVTGGVPALVLPDGITGLLDVGVTEELTIILDPNPNPEEADPEGVELTGDTVGVDPTGKDPDGRDPEAVSVRVWSGVDPTCVDSATDSTDVAEAEVETAVDTAEVDSTKAEPVAPAGETSVIGHTVVETATVEITTEGDPAGHSVTVGAQLVIVTSFVA